MCVLEFKHCSCDTLAPKYIYNLERISITQKGSRPMKMKCGWRRGEGGEDFC
jgi:hypothetical protein